MSAFSAPALSAPLRAALLMTLCCALIALSTFLAKVLGAGRAGAPMHAFQIVFGRYGFAILAILPFAIRRREMMRGAPWPAYIGRAAFGTTGVAALFAAAAMIPLADATAISFLNPVFAMVMAIVILGERVGPVRWIAAGIALSGGALLIRPGFGEIEPGALIALAAAVLIAGEITFAKFLSRSEGVLRVLLGTNLIAFAISGCAAVFVWRAPDQTELLLMAGVGLSMVSAQGLFMVTLSFSDSSFATPFFYGALVFAALYDALWFGVVPAPLSFAGAALIAAGAVVLAVRERRTQSD